MSVLSPDLINTLATKYLSFSKARDNKVWLSEINWSFNLWFLYTRSFNIPILSFITNYFNNSAPWSSWYYSSIPSTNHIKQWKL